MVVFALPRSNGETGSRLGVTATRKLGGAVQRARCKRRLREIFRGHPEELVDTPLDVVLNARKGCGDAPWDDLVRDYTRNIRKVRERLAGE
jgi:ribonuclease P protein component